MNMPILTAPATAGEWFPSNADLAQADRVAALPLDMRAQVLVDDTGNPIDDADLLYDFNFWGRPSQLAAYESTAHITAILAGRGFGKTRTMSELAHKLANKYPGSRGALIARTTADVRDTVVLGESGILQTCDPESKPRYVPNNRTVTWPNGTVASTFSAAVPDAIRGPQFNWALCDEAAAWPHRPPAGAIANAWDNIKLATRLGEHPQIFVMTTPRRVPLVIEMLNGTHKDPAKYKVIRGATASNRHLARVYHETIVAMYEGTSLAAQELEGELLGDVEGAMLRMEQIPRLPPSVTFDPLSYPIRIIAVDPSISDRPRDECGIVVVVATNERNPLKRKAFVVADESLRGSPGVWAHRVTNLAKAYRAYVVAEDNQGGEMVRSVIKQSDPDVPVVLARSADSKSVRAEPVVFSYEQRRTTHVDFFGELEAQWTSWVPGESLYSPDRLDACVIGVSAALVSTPSGMSGRIRLGGPRGGSSRRISDLKTHERSVTNTPTENAYRPPGRIRFHKLNSAERTERRQTRKREAIRARRRRGVTPPQ